MIYNSYDSFIRENMDLSDKHTRQYVAALEDAGKEQLINALSSALYDKIVNNVDDIDFGTIPTSRGDITKVQGWDNTEECISIIRRLVIEYKQSPAIVDVISTSIQNIKDRKGLFMKAYSQSVELPMLLYNLLVLSIERSVSLIIATSIQFIKDPSSTTPKQALDKVAYNRTMDDTMYKELVSFNNQCKDKSFDKIMNEAMKAGNIRRENTDVNLNYDTVSPIDEDDFSEEIPDLFGSDNYSPEYNDAVESDNIPSVVPGDGVEADDFPITEDDDEAPVDTSTSNPINSTLGESTYLNGKPFYIIEGEYGGWFAGARILSNGSILQLLRNIIYRFYYIKMQLSDFLDIQAQLIDANADDLETSNSGDPYKREKVVKRQRRAADKLRKWANRFNIDKKTSDTYAEKQIEREEKARVEENEDGDEGVLF